MDDSDEKKLDDSEGQSAMKLKGDSVLKVGSTGDNIWKGASSIFIWLLIEDTVLKHQHRLHYCNFVENGNTDFPETSLHILIPSWLELRCCDDGKG